MSIRSGVSSATSWTRRTLDAGLGLVYAVPTYLAQTIANALPTSLRTSSTPHPQPDQPSSTSPSTTLDTLRTSLSAPIEVSCRHLTIRDQLSVVVEELYLPAAVEAAPAQPAVHFFLITGNPGTVYFYPRFLARLYQLSNRSLHLHSLSFAGHHSPATLKLAASAASASSQPLYDLQYQLDVWLAYLRDWLQRLEQEAEQGQASQVVLCGHSIGAWMALELADQLGSDRVLHSFLLFPTLSHMARTPAGRRLQYPFAYGRPLLVPLAGLLAALVPSAALRWLVRANLSLTSSCTSASQRAELDETAAVVAELFGPRVVAQCLYLAHSELQTVVDERPAHSALMAAGRATLLSGTADEWDPAWLQEDRRRRIPGLREVRMEAEVKHAFVVGSSERVAEVVWQELQKVLELVALPGGQANEQQQLDRVEQAPTTAQAVVLHSSKL